VGVKSGIFEPHPLSPSPSTERGKREKEGSAPLLDTPVLKRITTQKSWEGLTSLLNA
jgi:hypothetical protein